MSDFLQTELVDTSISKLYLKSDLADVKFAFKGNGPTVLVPAHKLILASGSSVFHTMFFGSLPEKDTVEIVDATAEEFKEFLQFFYLRKIELTMTNMEGVARLADKYDILDCLNSCAEFLESKLTDNNMLWGYQLAISLDHQKLKKFCESKITDLSAGMFKTEAFLNCDQSVLKNILVMDELVCEEIDIFEACMEWAKTACRKHQLDENDSMNLREQLDDCIHLVQFGKMTHSEVGGILENNLYANMFDREELLEITRTSLVPTYEPKIFEKSTRKILSFSSNKMPELVLSRNLLGFAYYHFESVEKTRFTSNTSLLLGKISFCLNSAEDFNFDVVNCESIQTPYNGTVDCLNQEVTLDKGILIKAHVVYEIRVHIPLNMIHSHVRTNSCGADEVKLNADIIIKFPYTSDFVSSMSFKKV